MKKLLISCLISVALLGVSASSVQASKRVRTYPLYTGQILHHHAKKHMSRKLLKHYIYIMSIQMGSSRQSMNILTQRIFKRDSYKQLVRLYKSSLKAYAKINHHQFNLKTWK